MQGQALIHMTDVHKSFALQQQKLPILHIRSWVVQEGERLALLGPSGSGKSTALHLLSGVMKADAGEIRVCGYPLHELGEAERDRFRAGNIGYIMQDFHLIGSLTAAENVELVLKRSKDTSRRSLVEEWFERVGLADRMKHLPGQLSRGQQQRVAIVRALVNGPKLVLADEPTGSLDYETADATMRLLLDLCLEERLTLVTVTHDLHLAQLYPSRVQMKELNGMFRPSSKGTAILEGGVGA
jgi:putative ABC transport system ATP-binding protein